MVFGGTKGKSVVANRVWWESYVLGGGGGVPGKFYYDTIKILLNLFLSSSPNRRLKWKVLNCWVQDGLSMKIWNVEKWLIEFLFGRYFLCKGLVIHVCKKKMLENRMIVPFVYQTKPSNSLFEELKFISETYSFINGFIFILFVKLFRNTLTYVKRPFKTS